MNEIRHIEDLWADTPEPSRQWMTQTRNRLIDVARGGRGGAGLRGRLPSLSRGTARLATAGTLSVALAGGLIASQTVDFTSDPPGGGAGPTGDGPAAVANADVVLDRAATAVKNDPLPPAQPGDFAYVETKAMGTSVSGTGSEEGSKGSEQVSEYESQRMRWKSVDGSQPGLTRIKQQHGMLSFLRPGWRETPVPAIEKPSLAHPTYSYLRSLPHDADKLAAKIRDFCSSPPEDECRGGPFAVISGLLTRHVVPPEVRTALFKAAGKFEGVTVMEDAKLPVTGERGIAVALTEGEKTDKMPGERTELIFDPETYEFLGVREVATEKQDAGAQNVPGGTVEAGTVLHSLAIVDKGIVEKKGQQP